MEKLIVSESPSFTDALWQLPGQYVRVLYRPSVQTLSDVKKQAHWGVASLQLVLLIVVTIVFSILGHKMPSSLLHATAEFNLGSFRPFGFLPAPFTGMTLIGASFFIGFLTAYLFSKIYRGEGSFLEHMNTLLICTIPLVTISGALLLLPVRNELGALVFISVLVLFVYRMVLHGLTIMAVHGFGGKRATGIVLIIPIALLLLVALVLLIFAVPCGDWFDILDFDFGGGSTERVRNTGFSENASRSPSLRGKRRKTHAAASVIKIRSRRLRRLRYPFERM